MVPVTPYRLVPHTLQRTSFHASCNSTIWNETDGGQLTLSCQLACTAAILDIACTSLDTNPPCQSLSWPPNITSASSNFLLESKSPPCCGVIVSSHSFWGRGVEILNSAIGKASRKFTSKYCFSSWYLGNEKPQEGFKEDSTSNAHV